MHGMCHTQEVHGFSNTAGTPRLRASCSIELLNRVRMFPTRTFSLSTGPMPGIPAGNCGDLMAPPGPRSRARGLAREPQPKSADETSCHPSSHSSLHTPERKVGTTFTTDVQLKHCDSLFLESLSPSTCKTTRAAEQFYRCRAAVGTGKGLEALQRTPPSAGTQASPCSCIFSVSI